MSGSSAGAVGIVAILVIFGIFAGVIIGAAILRTAVRMVIGEGGTIWRAAGAVTVNFIASLIVAFLLAAVGIHNQAIEIVIGAILYAFIIQQFYQTTFGESLKIWLYNLLIIIAIFFVIGVVVALIYFAFN